MDSKTDMIIKNKLKSCKTTIPTGIDQRINQTFQTLTVKKSFNHVFFKYSMIASAFIVAIIVSVNIYKNNAPIVISTEPVTHEQIINEAPTEKTITPPTDAKTKGKEVVFNSIQDAEKESKLKIYAPLQLPTGIKLSKVHIQYLNETPSSLLLIYIDANGESAFQIYEKQCSDEDVSYLKELEDRKASNGKSMYEKLNFNNGIVYISGIGENNKNYTGHGKIENTIIKLSYFNYNFTKQEIISIFNSMK